MLPSVLLQDNDELQLMSGRRSSAAAAVNAKLMLTSSYRSKNNVSTPAPVNLLHDGYRFLNNVAISTRSVAFTKRKGKLPNG